MNSTVNLPEWAKSNCLNLLDTFDIALYETLCKINSRGFLRISKFLKASEASAICKNIAYDIILTVLDAF